MYVGNGVQILCTSVNLVSFRFPYTASPWLVPYHVKCYDQSGTKMNAFSLSQLHFPNKISLNNLYPTVQIQNINTSTFVWHASGR
jgi:hypothetical protein